MYYRRIDRDGRILYVAPMSWNADSHRLSECKMSSALWDTIQRAQIISRDLLRLEWCRPDDGEVAFEAASDEWLRENAAAHNLLIKVVQRRERERVWKGITYEGVERRRYQRY